MFFLGVGLSLKIRPLPHFASLVLRSRMFSDVVVLVPCKLDWWDSRRRTRLTRSSYMFPSTEVVLLHLFVFFCTSIFSFQSYAFSWFSSVFISPFRNFFYFWLFTFSLIFAETWGHVFRREGVVWEGTLPEYTLWQTARIQLTPGRLSIADLSVRVSECWRRVGGVLEESWRELERSWRRVGELEEIEWRDSWESYCEESVWSCFGSHTGYDLSGADKPPPHRLGWTLIFGGPWRMPALYGRIYDKWLRPAVCKERRWRRHWSSFEASCWIHLSLHSNPICAMSSPFATPCFLPQVNVVPAQC